MKFLINFYPNHCPNCGKSLNIKEAENRRWQLQDFKAGAAFRCVCGAEWQYKSMIEYEADSVTE